MVVLVKGRRKALTFEGKECPKGHTIRYVSTRNCVECVNKANDKWYAENTNSRRKAIHRWMSKEENKDKMRVTARRHARYNRGWAEGEPERAEALRPHVKKCACCGSKNPRTKTGWCADHDHKTGKFRAFICNPCNIMVGFVEKFKMQPNDQIRTYLNRYK